MSDEQAIEVIQLRHRLRAMAALTSVDTEAVQTLDRFRDLSELLDDVDLRFEHARWRVRFEQMGALKC